jgi:Ulp1 family protease
MKIKPHIKSRGRPKNTGKVWPRKTGKQRKSSPSAALKENIQPKTVLDNLKDNSFKNLKQCDSVDCLPKMKKAKPNPSKSTTSKKLVATHTLRLASQRKIKAPPCPPKKGKSLPNEALTECIPSTSVQTVQRKKVGPIHCPGTPAYRARVRRQHSQKEVIASVDLTNMVDVPELGDTSDIQSVIYIGNEKITKADLLRLQQKGRWLNDRLINAGMILLKNKFPHIGGLQDVILRRTLCFDCDGTPFVQILNTKESHWICVTNIGCKPNSIRVYDSMKTGDVPLQTKECIAALLNCQSRVIFVLFPDVQQQTDGASCGLFALAFAYTLCEGKDPSHMTYTSLHFREHLLRCIELKEMTSFACKNTLYKPGKPLVTKFSVYCLCRLPNTGDDMVCCSSCSEWYHYTCVNLPSGKKIEDAWYCSNCA